MSICVFTYLHTFVSIFTTVQGGGADLKSTSNFNYSTQLSPNYTDQSVIVEKLVLKLLKRKSVLPIFFYPIEVLSANIFG